MSIDKETVIKIAKLARLNLDEEEIKSLQKDLAEILDYVSILNSADTGDIDPTFQTLEKQTPMRDDEPKKIFGTEEMLQNAPRKKGGFILVKRVIEE